MRLFERVRIRVQHLKKPQQKCLCPLRRLRLMRPGRMTCRHLSRYSPSQEKTFARCFARDVDVVSLNHAAMVDVVPHSHEHVLALDPSVVPTSGTHTYGLDLFWNGTHSRAERGLEMATRAWIAVTHNRAYTRSVEQTHVEGPRWHTERYGRCERVHASGGWCTAEISRSFDPSQPLVQRCVRLGLADHDEVAAVVE